MSAAREDIVIERGTDFTYRFRIYNGDDDSVFDLSDYTAGAQIRLKPESRLPLVQMVGEIEDVELGQVVVSIAAEDTATLKVGKFHWDLFLLSETADNLNPVYGTATVVQTVTRNLT